MRDDGTTTYQLWRTAAGHAFFAEGNEAARQLVGAEGTLVWSVRARSWDEARRRMHNFLGWPPYRPGAPVVNRAPDDLNGPPPAPAPTDTAAATRS